jgi:hypothetical protein
MRFHWGLAPPASTAIATDINPFQSVRCQFRCQFFGAYHARFDVRSKARSIAIPPRGVQHLGVRRWCPQPRQGSAHGTVNVADTGIGKGLQMLGQTRRECLPRFRRELGQRVAKETPARRPARSWHRLDRIGGERDTLGIPSKLTRMSRTSKRAPNISRVWFPSNIASAFLFSNFSGTRRKRKRAQGATMTRGAPAAPAVLLPCCSEAVSGQHQPCASRKPIC